MKLLVSKIKAEPNQRQAGWFHLKYNCKEQAIEFTEIANGF